MYVYNKMEIHIGEVCLDILPDVCTSATYMQYVYQYIGWYTLHENDGMYNGLFRSKY